MKTAKAASRKYSLQNLNKDEKGALERQSQVVVKAEKEAERRKEGEKNPTFILLAWAFFILRSHCGAWPKSQPALRKINILRSLRSVLNVHSWFN